MRIISGLHKGRRFTAPKKLPVRPTTDRSKEALFNILQHQIEFSEIAVLDLFSGTGSISYEFASRGVTKLTAVDNNRHCIRFIQTTAANLSMQLRIVQKDCIAFIKEQTEKYDLIFADPPYNFDLETYGSIIKFTLDRLGDNGQVIIEHFDKINLSKFEGFKSCRTYGNSTFSFFSN